MLVAARQRADQRLGGGRFDRQLGHIVLHQLLNLALVEEQAHLQVPVEACDGYIVVHRQHAENARGTSVLRQHGDGALDGVARAADLQLLALVGDGAVVCGAHAEDALHQLGALRAHQAGHAQHLAFAQAERNVAEAARVDGREVLHLKDHLARHVLARRVEVGQLAAHHVGDDFIGRQILRIPGADVLAIAHDGDLVGDAQNLVHLVADVDDADALIPQIPNDAEQGLHLALGQRAGGLIQNQHLAVGRHRLGDFHQLHLRDAQAAQALLGVKIHVHLFEQRLGVAVHGLVVYHRDGAQHLLGGISTHVDVLRHRALGDGLQLLMHHGDAQVECLQGVVDVHGLSLVDDFALIHLINAKHALHQRGLAGAILAHQGVHGTGAQLKLSIVQRLHTGERLGHIAHFQAVFAHRRASLHIGEGGACAAAHAPPM